MLWQIVSLRSLWPKKWTRWVDLFNGILFLIAVANVLLIESTVDKMDIKSFSNWEDSGLKLSFIADADLQFPDHPNLSRMLLANYVTSMMVVWRFCIGILTFSGYMRFVDKISPMFPLLTYPMDVIAAGGTSTIVFCITISMIVLGFVQMFVAPYYLYLEQTKDFPTTLHFLFQNLVGNTNTRVFLIPDVADSGQGTAMLTVFLFVMTYVFFTMFVAIIATNYRVVCRQIEKTPFHDFEPFKARMTRLFCEYPKICKAIGPFGFIRHICSGREDDQDLQAQANARDEPEGPEEEDGDGLTISAVEELSDVEKSRREIEATFFERFEKLHENMRILEVHFETLMGRTEQIADLQDRVVEVSDLQSGLEEALAMHYKHVRQQIKLSDMKGLSSPTSSPKHAISPKHDLGLSLDGSIRV